MKLFFSIMIAMLLLLSSCAGTPLGDARAKADEEWERATMPAAEWARRNSAIFYTSSTPPVNDTMNLTINFMTAEGTSKMCNLLVEIHCRLRGGTLDQCKTPSPLPIIYACTSTNLLNTTQVGITATLPVGASTPPTNAREVTINVEWLPDDPARGIIFGSYEITPGVMFGQRAVIKISVQKPKSFNDVERLGAIGITLMMALGSDVPPNTLLREPTYVFLGHEVLHGFGANHKPSD